jgi:AcrR family transcriptional regulator
MARPLDPTIDRAITEATLTLLQQRGFARMSMEAVASVAGVGKPAIYRRFRDKAELVATVIEGQLPHMEVPTSATRAPSCGWASTVASPPTRPATSG